MDGGCSADMSDSCVPSGNLPLTSHDKLSKTDLDVTCVKLLMCTWPGCGELDSYSHGHGELWETFPAI